MAIKTWVPTVASAWNTTTNWNGSTLPVAGDDVFFNTNIASTTAGVVTLSTTNAQPGSIRLIDPTSTFYSWQITGSSQITTFGTGTTVYVDNAPSYIWNTIGGTAPLIVSASSYGNFLALSGSANTYTGGTRIINGALRIADDLSLGALPATLQTSNIIFNNSASLMVPTQTYTIPGTRGIYLSGTGIISSSLSTPNIHIYYHMLAPTSGPGQIIFKNGISTSTSAYSDVYVYLTGTNSVLNNTGGIRIEGSSTTYLYTSGTRNIGNASIEFVGRSTYYSSSPGQLLFYQDPAISTHTMPGNIRFSGPATSGATRYLSVLQGAITEPQTHIYAGNLSSEGGLNHTIYLGHNSPSSGLDKLLTVKFTGNNSALINSTTTYLGYRNTTVIFSGANSVPPNSTLRGYYDSTYNTASNSGNWIFSSSMTIANTLDSSWLGSSGVGAKINVARGNVVTASGLNYIQGPLIRVGSGNNLAWRATSFVGPGEWLQTGQVIGAGALVLEPGSRFKTTHASNSYAGPLYISGAVFTALYDSSFGAIPGVPGTKLYLDNATIAVSSSISLHPNILAQVNTGTITFDVPAGQGFYVNGPVSYAGDANINIRGGGQVYLSRAPVNSLSIPGLMYSDYVYTRDADFGAVPASFEPTNIVLGVGLPTNIDGNFTINSNRGILLGVESGIMSYGSPRYPGSISGGRLVKTGPGSFALNYTASVGLNTYTGGTSILSGAIILGPTQELGAIPATLDASNIIFNNSASLIAPNTTMFVLSGTRGIYLSGTGILSGTVAAASSISVQGPISGPGQIIFSDSAQSGSTSASPGIIAYMTGAASAFNNSGGVRIDSAGLGYLYISGSRTIQSLPIEFRNKGFASAGSLGTLYFVEDPAIQTHTMPGDISWTGAAGTGAKTISQLASTFQRPQTHVYSGRLITQPTNLSDVRMGGAPSSGIDNLLTIRLTGNNSGLYGNIYPAYNSNTSVIFDGSQSLPHSSSVLRAIGNTTWATASDSANWVFSGSMLVNHSIQSSPSSYVGAKLNVPAGNIVTATGPHGLTGSLTRYGSGARLAWQATSLVGPGEWIQSGTLSGAGSLVLEPGSRLTINNNANIFTGVITASNAVITVPSTATDTTFGATPGSKTYTLELRNSTLATSASLNFSQNRLIRIAGASTFDILSGRTLTLPTTMSLDSLTTNATSLNKQGGGSIIVPSTGSLIIQGSTSTTMFMHLLAPVTGSGQLNIETIYATGSNTVTAGAVELYVTGTNSSLGNSGGVKLTHTYLGRLITSGSRTIGSSSIEFFHKGIYSGSGAGTGELRFYEDPNIQVHEIPGNISWTGFNANGASGYKHLSYMVGRLEKHQTHIYSGRISTQASNTSRFYLTYNNVNPGADNIVHAKFTGDNSGLYGEVYPSYGGSIVTFVGQQSLPNASASLNGGVQILANTASLNGSWIFSGSMTSAHNLQSSRLNFSTVVGAKLNVERGMTVTHSNTHGLTGSIHRKGTYPNLAWQATSFTGPGTWIENGKLEGPGGFIVEAGSNLVLMNPANSFSGGFINSGTLVVGAGVNFDSVNTGSILLAEGSSLIVSNSLTLEGKIGSANRGSVTIDILGGNTLTVDTLGSGLTTINKRGLGTLNYINYPGVSVNVIEGSATTYTGTFGLFNNLTASSDSAFGSTPASFERKYFMLDNSSWRITDTFTSNPNRGFLIFGDSEISVDANKTLTIGSKIAGAGRLKKVGNGSLSLVNEVFSTISSRSGYLVLSGARFVDGLPGQNSMELIGSNISVTGDTYIGLHRDISSTGDINIDIAAGATLYLSAAVTSSAANYKFIKTGAGRIVSSYGMGDNEIGSFVVSSGSVLLTTETGVGKEPSSLNLTSIILDKSSSIIYPNTQNNIIPANRGIYLSGTGIFSASYTIGTPQFYMQSPISGPGRIIFSTAWTSGTAVNNSVNVFLTGTNASLNNSGGLQINYTSAGSVYSSGSRNINSASIEFRNTGVYATGGAGYMYFYEDPDRQTHVFPGNISWTGASGSASKYLSYPLNTIAQPQTHEYSGRLITQPAMFNQNFYVGYNNPTTGKDKLLHVKLTGDNSQLYGVVHVSSDYSSRTTFVGSQSLPHSSSMFRTYLASANVLHDQAGLVTFSGSMTIPNAIQSSFHQAAMQIDVAAGDTVVHTGLHQLTGTLLRNPAVAPAVSSWRATSFVGPGKWIQSGSLAGLGGIIIGSGSNITLNNPSNTFSGGLINSGVLTIGPNGGLGSLGTGNITFVTGSTLALSCTLSLVTQPVTLNASVIDFDIAAGNTLYLSSFGTSALTINKKGEGVLDIIDAPGTPFPANINIIAGTVNRKTGSATFITASSDLDLGEVPSQTIETYFPVSGSSWRIAESFTSNPRKGMVVLSNSDISIDEGKTFKFGGAITGNYAFRKIGLGDLTLSGAVASSVYSTNGKLTLERVTVPSTTPAQTFQLSGSTLVVTGTTSFTNRSILTTGNFVVDIAAGSALTISSQVSSSIATASFVKSGPGTITLPNLGATNFNGPFIVNSGTVLLTTDTSTGPVPGALMTDGIVLGNSGTIFYPNAASYVIDRNRGIYVSGTGIISSSYVGSVNGYVHGPITGPGEIVFNSYGSTWIYLTSSNSAIDAAGGVRIMHGYQGGFFTSGSRTIRSSSIELFCRTGSYTDSAATLEISYYQDPAVNTHTIPGNITFSGTTSAALKRISGLRDTITQPQTHIYTGRIALQSNHTADLRLGQNSPSTGYDKLLMVRLTGDNSRMYGRIFPAFYYNSSIAFVGSQSLPHSSSQLLGNHYSQYTTASNSANWIFSGSMTLRNPLESSFGGGYLSVGAKLNVEAGSTVVHTGRHGLTGSLTRYGTGANIAWNATSLVGPGEWIQSGTMAGLGSIVLEPSSRFTIANNANTSFVGVISASNAVLTIAANGGDNSLGANSSTEVQRLNLRNSTLASSASMTLSPFRRVDLAGNTTFDIRKDNTVNIPARLVGTSDIVMRGGGTLVLSGANVLTGSLTVATGTVRFESVSSIPLGSITVLESGSVIVPSSINKFGGSNINLILSGGNVSFI